MELSRKGLRKDVRRVGLGVDEDDSDGASGDLLSKIVNSHRDVPAVAAYLVESGEGNR